MPKHALNSELLVGNYADATQKTCPMCHKKFLMYSKSHAYILYSNKYKCKIHLCSWKCLRAYEEKQKSRLDRKHEEDIQKQLRGEM